MIKKQTPKHGSGETLDNLMTCYINLDARTDRRLSMEERLKAALPRLSFFRLPALEGDDRKSNLSRAELGAFLSHAEAIKTAGEDGPTLVLEDDVIFAKHLQNYLGKIIGHLKAQSGDWDILFLSQMVDISNVSAIYKALTRKEELQKNSDNIPKLAILDCKSIYASGASAYIVNPLSKQKLLALIQAYEKIGYPLPIDLCFKQLIDRDLIKAKFTLPHLTGLVGLEDSSIQQPHRTSVHSLMEDLSNLYFIDNDIENMVQRYMPPLESVRQNQEKFVACQILFNRMILRPGG
jgi:GR25 family glycosyltransferase involved in LPS biosynthesis